MLRVTLITALSLVGLFDGGSVVPGAPDRIVQIFAPDGTLMSQTSYRGERKVGRYVSFWPDGARRVEALYGGDVIEGEYRSWHANGQLAELRHYEAGHEAGAQQAWTSTGELFLNFEIRNGRHYGLTNSRPCLPVKDFM